MSSNISQNSPNLVNFYKKNNSNLSYKNQQQLIKPENKVNFKGNLSIDKFERNESLKYSVKKNNIMFTGLNANKLLEETVEKGATALEKSTSKQTDSSLKSLAKKLLPNSEKKRKLTPLKDKPILTGSEKNPSTSGGTTGLDSTQTPTYGYTNKELHDNLKEHNPSAYADIYGSAPSDSGSTVDQTARATKALSYQDLDDSSFSTHSNIFQHHTHSFQGGVNAQDHLSNISDYTSDNNGILSTIVDNSDTIQDVISDTVPFVQIFSSGQKILKAGKHMANGEYGKAAEVGVDATVGAAAGSAGALAGLKGGALAGAACGGPAGAVVGGLGGAIIGGLGGRQIYNGIKNVLKNW